MRILTQVLKQVTWTLITHCYYKLAEWFRLLNWTERNFSHIPAFYKPPYNYHAGFKLLPNLKQNSDRNLLGFLAEITGHRGPGGVYCQGCLRQISEAFPRYAQWNWHFVTDTVVIKSSDTLEVLWNNILLWSKAETTFNSAATSTL